MPGSSFEKYNITVERSNNQHVITFNESRVKYDYTQKCWYWINKNKCLKESAPTGKFHLIIDKTLYGTVSFIDHYNSRQLIVYSTNQNPYLVFSETDVETIETRSEPPQVRVKSSTLTAKSVYSGTVSGTYISKANKPSSNEAQARGSENVTNTKKLTSEINLGEKQKFVNQTGCGAIKQ